MTIGIHGMKKGRQLDREMHRNTGITPFVFPRSAIKKNNKTVRFL